MLRQRRILLSRLVQLHLRSVRRKYSTEQQVLTKEIGNSAVIILNRPRTLNSMTLEMQIELLKIMKRLENEKSLVIIKGAGDRALSSGGDLLIFKEEYKNNSKYMDDMMLAVNTNIYLISKYKIPIIVLMNGITIGGGAGYSVNARYGIVTEKTKFSMPEVKVAFNPNASGSYFLNHTPHKLGYYLGLTGDTLYGSDVLRAGYGTHYCNSKNLNLLEEELVKCNSDNDIKNILERLCENNIPNFSLTPILEKINNCFSEPTIEGIISKLEDDGSSWSKRTLDKLTKYSPTALKVTLRQLQKSRDLNLEDCLVMESSLSSNIYKFPDIYEGTRIVLQDKGNIPKWNPSELSQVTEELIIRHFIPVLEEKQRRIFKEIDQR